MEPAPGTAHEASDEIGHFPLQDLLTDFLISGFGILVGITIVVSNMGGMWKLVFGAFLAAAAWFFWRTWRFYKMRVDLENGIARVNGKAFAVADLSWVKLRFYGSLRQRSKGQGTYQLSLRFGEGGRLTVDQRLSNFQELIEHIANSSPPCDDTSEKYFAAHGIQINTVAAQQVPQHVQRPDRP